MNYQYGDYLLHEVASQSLDLTIAQTLAGEDDGDENGAHEQPLGRNCFDAALARHRRLRKLEEEQCAPHVKFPWSDTGERQLQLAKQNCYMFRYDFGCGYPCIDQVIAD
jgi:hypothetical protein